MEGNGEISDTDSGIILHSGSDSPRTSTKDVTTHTRAMKLKHQSLQDSLQLCVLELKKLCIREAELTGELSADYPLAPGETPPKVRRRIGASFQLDEQSIPRGPEESPLNLVDAELALQLKIYEAARGLCREEHQNKAVRRSRLQQCKREEKRVKELQESAFRLRLQHGRSSPLPAFTIPLQDYGNSDDSSLSDSPVLDEDVPHPPPSSGPACWDQNPPLQTSPVSSPSTANSSMVSSPVASQPHTPVKRTPSQLTPIKRTLSHHTPIRRTPSQLTPSQLTPSQLTPSQLTPGLFPPRRAGSPGLDSMLSFSSTPESEAPPIQPSPWTESSLDKPFQKTKKSRSSTKSTSSSPASSQVLPPLEACLGNPSLPQQLSQLQLSDRLANGAPLTPEPRIHRNLSLRISEISSDSIPETPAEDRSRGRTRSARRRLTDCSVTAPETAGGNPVDHYGPPEYPAGHYGPQGTTTGYPADHYGPPETTRGHPADHYGPPETTRGYPADHYGPPETTGGNPLGYYGPPETTRGYLAGHYGPPETTWGSSAGHYGPPETTRGYPPFHYGSQENSEDGHSEHSSSTRSVCQEQQGEFPRARPLQHPGPTGGPGPHVYQDPGLYQGPRYQSGPGFNPGHYPGDVAYALDLDLVRGYHGHQAPSNRRDYRYAEAPAPPMTAPRRAPQEVRLSRSPSLWEHPRYRSNGPPRQLVDDQLKSWHHRNQFRGPRPRSLDRQGAVRVKAVPDWVSPLAHNHRYQEQVLKARVQRRPVDGGTERWFRDDSSKAVSQV